MDAPPVLQPPPIIRGKVYRQSAGLQMAGFILMLFVSALFGYLYLDSLIGKRSCTLFSDATDGITLPAACIVSGVCIVLIGILFLAPLQLVIGNDALQTVIKSAGGTRVRMHIPYHNIRSVEWKQHKPVSHEPGTWYDILCIILMSEQDPQTWLTADAAYYQERAVILDVFTKSLKVIEKTLSAKLADYRSKK